MNIPQRLANLETPDLTQKQNYVVDQLPEKFALNVLRAKRFLALLHKDGDAEFFGSKAHFAQSNDSWLPHIHLGSGGFGKVGCWVKRNSNGDIIDEIAVKQMGPDDDLVASKFLFWDSKDSTRALLKEAVFQKQLNLSQLENIVHLRGYKFFSQHLQDSSPSTQRMWRFYLEFAPYGSLYALKTKYTWRNSFLPEAFLWHIFDSLAKAAQAMRAVSLEGLPARSKRLPRAGSELVNFDIKADNIFLGYSDHRMSGEQQSPEPQSESESTLKLNSKPKPELEPVTFGGTKKYDYPVIKMGDFGIATFTSQSDRQNPQSYLNRGTPACQPPEQVHYGANWMRDPHDPWLNEDFNFGGLLKTDTHLFDDCGEANNIAILREQVRKDPKNNILHFQLREKVHVWAIAKIIFGLMGLSGPSELWGLSTTSYQEFKSFGRHQIADFDTTPFDFSRSGTSPYSRELTDLVRECMRPIVAERLDLKAMEERTSEQMQRWDNLYDSANESHKQRTKLYFRDHEILDMPQGHENVPDDYGYYHQMRHADNGNPDWRPLYDPTMPVWRDSPTIDKYEKQYEHLILSARKIEQKKFIRIEGRLYRRSDPRIQGKLSDSSSRSDQSSSSSEEHGSDFDSSDDANQARRSPPAASQGPATQPLVQQNLAPQVPPNPVPNPPGSPTHSVTDDPDDSDCEIARRTLRNRRRTSYYRRKCGRKNDPKKITRKIKANKTNKFKNAHARNLERRDRLLRQIPPGPLIGAHAPGPGLAPNATTTTTMPLPALAPAANPLPSTAPQQPNRMCPTQ